MSETRSYVSFDRVSVDDDVSTVMGPGCAGAVPDTNPYPIPALDPLQLTYATPKLMMRKRKADEAMGGFSTSKK